jgi:hypothetical protein
VKTPRAEDPNPSWFSRHSGALFVGGFGLVFTVAGLLIWFVAVPSASARAAAAEALSVVVPGHVPSYLEGVRVLLEAPIAVDVPEGSGSNTSGLTRHLQAPGLWESVEQGEG